MLERDRIYTSCFPVARIASAIARPTPPVPPAIATLTMIWMDITAIGKKGCGGSRGT
jgi:hypothetical protein